MPAHKKPVYAITLGARGMVCPKCNSARTEVAQTVPGDGFVCRRRKCVMCSESFVTMEILGGLDTYRRLIRELRKEERKASEEDLEA